MATEAPAPLLEQGEDGDLLVIRDCVLDLGEAVPSDGLGQLPASPTAWTEETGSKPSVWTESWSEMSDRSRKDVAGCSRSCSLRIGEATNPGPRVRHERAPLQLASASLVEPATAKLRDRFWTAFAYVGRLGCRGPGEGAFSGVLLSPQLLVISCSWHLLSTFMMQGLPFIITGSWWLTPNAKSLAADRGYEKHRPPLPERFSMRCAHWPFFGLETVGRCDFDGLLCHLSARGTVAQLKALPRHIGGLAGGR